MARLLPLELRDRADWSCALVLFCQGRPHDEIVEKSFVTMAALRKKIAREGWVELRERTALPVHEDHEPTLHERGEIIRNQLGDCMHKSVVAFSALPEPTTMKALEAHVETLSEIIKPAAQLFGWSESNAGSSLNINLLTMSREVKGPRPIDVQSEPALPESTEPESEENENES